VETKPKIWYSPEFPATWVIEDTSGEMWTHPNMAPFDGERSTLMRIREGEARVFPGELLVELVGVSEIATRARVAVATVQAWRARHADFPEPLAELRAGPVWLWNSVERWLAIAPKVGRPARESEIHVRVPSVRSPVLKHLRGDGHKRTFSLRDRFELGSVRVEVDGVELDVIEEPTGRTFSLAAAPANGADVKLEYSTILA
jgi:hypothetical protein